MIARDGKIRARVVGAMPVAWFAAILSAIATTLIACAAPTSEEKRPSKLALIQQVIDEHGPALKNDATRVARTMIDAEQTYGVDAFLLLALAQQESELNPKAKGQAGGLGLMQLRPATAHSVAKDAGIDLHGAHNLFDPALNVRIAAIYLADLKEKFERWNLALTAYNIGPTRLKKLLVEKKDVPAGYASRVEERYQRLRRSYEQGEPEADTPAHG